MILIHIIYDAKQDAYLVIRTDPDANPVEIDRFPHLSSAKAAYPDSGVYIVYDETDLRQAANAAKFNSEVTEYLANNHDAFDQRSKPESR